ncbi:MAG TPA: hypothetical protein VFB34_06720 [Chloroflexota bacterium]|nr:hypothetical protein [Chloroflexota bacterium]
MVETAETLATGAGLLALLALVEILGRRRLPHDITRRLAHMGSGAEAATFPLYLHLRDALLLAVGFGLLLAWAWREGKLRSIHDVARPTVGATAFPLGLALAALISWSHPFAFAFAALVLALSDPAAAMIGGRRAMRRWSWPGGKTPAGTGAFMLVSFVLAVDFGLATSDPRPLAAVLVSGVLAAIEAPLLWGLDNLVVPVAAAVLGSTLLGL